MSRIHHLFFAIVAAGLLSSGIQAAGAASAYAAQAGGGTGTEARSNILDTAAKAGSFKTLGAAIKAAGLEDVLQGPGPFTVFAPTDEAFANLPPGTLDSLLKPENKEKLRSILTYHVIPADVSAERAMQTPSVKTVNGQMLKLTRDADGRLTINGKAHVIKTDIKASNGVIHVIDAVLMPE